MKSYQRVAHGVAYVPQGRMVFSAMMVEENIETGLGKGRKTGMLAEIYELFPVLKEMRKRRGGNLSGGQQQQLAIARSPANRRSSCSTSRRRASSPRSSARWRAR